MKEEKTSGGVMSAFISTGVLVILVWSGVSYYQDYQKKQEVAECNKLQGQLDKYSDFAVTPDQADKCYQLGVSMFNERVR